MRFLDRQVERKRLDSLVGPGLAVLWGRRRVGKTRLLVEWCRARGGIYAVADQSAEAVQRRYFAEALAERLPGFGDVVYPDWRSLLRAFARAVASGTFRGPLVIDELPHLVQSSPSLASVLQNWVDHEAREAGVLLVVAGSSQRMMQGIVLDRNAPLFGRASQAFELGPLGAGYLPDALEVADPARAVRAWAVWGGIPWYWELAARFGAELEAAVEALVLDPSGVLHHEPDRQLLEERPSAAVLRPLLDAIGAGAHRPSEIAARVGQPATSLARSLSRLQELRLVRRELPFGENERSSKKALYRLDDPLFRFWFRSVASRRGALATASRSTRLGLAAQAIERVVPEAWEDLCRVAVPALGPSHLGGHGAFGPAQRYWRGSEHEWDVVSLSLDGRCALLGEVKWAQTAMGAADLSRVAHALMNREPPTCRDLSGRELVRALFVPVVPKGLRRTLPCPLVDASAVLAALR